MPPPGQYSLARTPGNLAVHEVAYDHKGSSARSNYPALALERRLVVELATLGGAGGCLGAGPLDGGGGELQRGRDLITWAILGEVGRWLVSER
jgi:hypothetical protein